MPVSYYVDPKILEDKDLKGLAQITLSYTFHRSAGAEIDAFRLQIRLDRRAQER
jgi:cytochrome c oxidase assembly protein subunit 11